MRYTLLLFYLALSWGFSVNVHFCGGEFASVKVVSDNATCCCGPMGMMEGCCSNESIFLKLETEQNVSESFKLNLVEIASAIEIPPYIEPIPEEPQGTFYSESPDPPPQDGRSVRIQHCSLITFG